MTIYKLNRPQEELTVTHKFNSYNAAIAFQSGTGLLNPSKPYKRMLCVNGAIVPVWCVTLPNVSAAKAKPTYERIAA